MSQPVDPKSSDTNQQEEDLELSDVPMDESRNGEEDDDDDDDDDEELEDELEAYSNLLDEETKFIYDKIFHAVNSAKKITNLRDGEDDIPEEPEEDLDEEEKKRLLVENLDPEQMLRYEYYRRTPVNKSGVKKIANTVLNQSVSNNVAVVLAGVSKVFIGQVVVRAKEIKKRYDKANYLIKLNEKKLLLGELERQEHLMRQRIESNKSESIIDLSPFKSKIEEIKTELEKIDLKNINENGPLLPEHIREAWRLYQLESGTAPSSQWRSQGEKDGLMFR
jgi:transcription initiation factor TFIID subunit 11